MVCGFCLAFALAVYCSLLTAFDLMLGFWTVSFIAVCGFVGLGVAGLYVLVFIGCSLSCVIRIRLLYC